MGEIKIEGEAFTPYWLATEMGIEPEEGIERALFNLTEILTYLEDSSIDESDRKNLRKKVVKAMTSVDPQAEITVEEVKMFIYPELDTGPKVSESDVLVNVENADNQETLVKRAFIDKIEEDEDGVKKIVVNDQSGRDYEGFIEDLVEEIKDEEDLESEDLDIPHISQLKVANNIQRIDVGEPLYVYLRRNHKDQLKEVEKRSSADDVVSKLHLVTQHCLGKIVEKKIRENIKV